MPSNVKCDICSRVFLSTEKLHEHKAKHHLDFKDDSELERKCKVAVWDLMHSDAMDPLVALKGNTGLKYLGIVAKREQTQSARETTTVLMARELATNKEEFQKYLRVAMPSAPILKALPAGKTA